MTENLLTRAVANVMKDVRRQGAKDENKFAGYKYTSVDDYKDHLRPLLAMQGLAVHCDQVGFSLENVLTSGKGGDKNTLAARFDFEIWLTHVSGAADENPERITVMLPFVGAQTTGQARSYALKEWAKSRFWATSGNTTESDPDAHEQMQYSERKSVGDKRAMNDLAKGHDGPSAYVSRPVWDVLEPQIRPLPFAKMNDWWDKTAAPAKMAHSWKRRLFIEFMTSAITKAPSAKELINFYDGFKSILEDIRQASPEHADDLDQAYAEALDNLSSINAG